MVNVRSRRILNGGGGLFLPFCLLVDDALLPPRYVSMMKGKVKIGKRT